MKFLRSLFFLTVVLSLPLNVMAQQAGATPVQCGTIIESEFTSDAQPQSYTIEVAPGDVLSVSATPLGDTLKLSLGIQAPNDDFIGVGGDNASSGFANPSKDPSIQTGVLSARGRYIITAHNALIYPPSYWSPFDDDLPGGIGVYTLYIGCTLRDGTVIEPGDAPGTGGGEFSEDATSVNVPFSGFGFPGLPSVDFTDAIAIPFQMGDAPNAGGINPGFDSVFGFTLDANGGDKFDLTFTRSSGNLNLGLAVLAPDNTVVYQASLVNAERMNTLFTFPAAGQYTIGVWKMDIAAPATPENTSFQLTGTLNP